MSVIIRHYFPYTGTAPHTTFTLDAFWTDPGSIIRLPLVTTKTSTAMTSWNPGLGAGLYAGKYQWVSPHQAPYDWSLLDSIKIQCRIADTANDTTILLALSVRVMYGTDTVRGILYQGKGTAYTIDGTLRNINMGVPHVHVQNAFSMSQDDHIVAELGLYTDLNGSALMSFGDDSATDLGENLTDTAAYNPWIEFTMGPYGPSPIGPAGGIASGQALGTPKMRGTIQSEA